MKICLDSCQSRVSHLKIEEIFGMRDLMMVFAKGSEFIRIICSRDGKSSYMMSLFG